MQNSFLELCPQLSDQNQMTVVFCAYLTVHFKKSTVHTIGGRKICITTDIIIYYTLVGASYPVEEEPTRRYIASNHVNNL